MTKKSERPAISDEELNSYLSIDEQYVTTDKKTTQTADSERRTAPETAMESDREVPGVTSAPVAQAAPSIPTMLNSPSGITSPTQPDPLRRLSARQRKASLDEYRETFMTAPKITDRQPVFVSRHTRDSIDSIVRRLGERKMSVSGFLENLARQHLEAYAEDIEVWKRL